MNGEEFAKKVKCRELQSRIEKLEDALKSIKLDIELKKNLR